MDMEEEGEGEATTAQRKGSIAPGEKQPFAVQMTAPSGVTTELESGVTVLGRGAKFGITDRRVSRKHAEVTVSKETNTVTLMSVRSSSFFKLFLCSPIRHHSSQHPTPFYCFDRDLIFS
jgi:pSer/pThr/pTyr-binding forkhead associated (FHA) protein